MSDQFETLKIDFKTKVRNSGFKSSLPLEDLLTVIYHLTISRKNDAKKNRKVEETEAVNDGTNNLSGKGKEKVRQGKFPVLEE